MALLFWSLVQVVFILITLHTCKKSRVKQLGLSVHLLNIKGGRFVILKQVVSHTNRMLYKRYSMQTVFYANGTYTIQTVCYPSGILYKRYAIHVARQVERLCVSEARNLYYWGKPE